MTLLAGRWLLHDAAPALDGSAPHVELDVDGAIAGHAGVNRFAGRYRVDGDALEIGPLAVTRMAGPEPAMRAERELLGALDGRCAFRLDGDELVLGDGPGALRLRRDLDAATPVPAPPGARPPG